MDPEVFGLNPTVCWPQNAHWNSKRATQVDPCRLRSQTSQVKKSGLCSNGPGRSNTPDDSLGRMKGDLGADPASARARSLIEILRCRTPVGVQEVCRLLALVVWIGWTRPQHPSGSGPKSLHERFFL